LEGKRLRKIKSIFYILISFIIPFIIISNLFISLGITDRKLWNGSEPHITQILKGSNIEHFGRWNEEDSKFIAENIGNREYLEAACKEKIINRYTSVSPIRVAGFLVTKLAMQWGLGDCLASFLSQSDISQHKVKIDIWNKGSVWYQLFYLSLLLLIIKGLFNKKEYLGNNIINIFYIIFCGYGITFLILEAQERYAFIINWIFVILPLTAISKNSNSSELENINERVDSE
jgi:cytochrome c oxidase subunit IV